MNGTLMHLVVVAAAAAALAALAAPAAWARNLAVVDGKPISDEELKRSAAGLGPRAQVMLGNPVARRQFLDQMIDTRVLAKAAETAGLEKTREYEEQLAAARATILAQLLGKRHVEEATTDARLRAFFAKDPTRFSKKEIRASHIILATEDEAKAVAELARKPGADFEALAKARSTGPSGTRGGDLGWFARGRMVPEFEQAAFATPKGEVHAHPVKTQFGWHVLRVVDVRGDDDVKFDDVREQVREEAEREAREELVKGLREKAKVAVDEDAMKSFGL